jgi:hypothetical protein
VKNNGEEETREEICLWGKVFVKKRGNCTSFAKKVPREGVKLRSSSEKKSKKRKKSDITEKSVHAWGMHPNSRISNFFGHLNPENIIQKKRVVGTEVATGEFNAGYRSREIGID